MWQLLCVVCRCPVVSRSHSIPTPNTSSVGAGLVGTMVVKTRRRQHRPLCLCCAEAGAMPFSLRRAVGSVDDAWMGLDDDVEEREPVVSARAYVVVHLSNKACEGGFSTRAGSPCAVRRRCCQRRRRFARSDLRSSTTRRRARRGATRRGRSARRRRSGHVGGTAANAQQRGGRVHRCSSCRGSGARGASPADLMCPQHMSACRLPKVAAAARSGAHARPAASPAAPTKLCMQTSTGA